MIDGDEDTSDTMYWGVKKPVNTTSNATPRKDNDMTPGAKYKISERLWLTNEDGEEMHSMVTSVGVGDNGDPEYGFDTMNAWGYYHFRAETSVSPLSLRQRVQRLEKLLGVAQ